MGQLGLFEVGGHVNVRQRHQRQQLRPRLDVLPDLAGPIAGDSGEGGADHRVVEVVAGQRQGGASLLSLGLFLIAHRSQHVELVPRGSQRRAFLRQCRGGLAVVGLGRLQALPTGEIGGRQLCIALQIALRARQVGLRRDNLRLRLLDHRALQVHAAVIGQNRGLFGCHRRLGLRHPGRKVAVVDHEQHLPGGNPLVVGDPGFLDVALDHRADHRDVALDVGVVGRLLEAPDVPPIPADRGAEDDDEEDDDDDGCDLVHGGLEASSPN